MLAILFRALAWLSSADVVASITRTILKVLAGAGIFVATTTAIPAFFSATFLSNAFAEIVASTPFFGAIYYALNLLQINYAISVIFAAYITSAALDKASSMITK